MISETSLPVLSLAIFVAWGLGVALLGALWLVPRLRERIRPLWYLMATELLILAIGVLPWYLPGWALAAVLVLAAARIGFEAGHVYGLAAQRNLAWPLALGLAIAAAAVWLLGLGYEGSRYMGVASLIAIAAAVFTIARADWRSSAVARFILYPGLPFLAFVWVGGTGNAATMVLSFLFVELFDSFSLLGGKLFGRTLLVPRLSPRKTWEGLGTGIAALLLACWPVAALTGANALQLAGIAVVVGLSALVGDLVASVIKRKAGVKDYPAVLPVQGGLLDIIDSWIVAAPAAVIAGHLLNW